MRRWLDDVERDIHTPDLWADLRRDAGMLVASSYAVSNNAPFTSDEQIEVAKHLQGVAEHVLQQYSISSKQTQQMNAMIDYAANAAHRLGRIDWRNALIGAVIAWVISAAVPPEYGSDILMDVLRPIGHLLLHLNAPEH